MRKMLAQMGCVVAVAHNGREVFARWEQGGLDLILMDVQMPAGQRPGGDAGRFVERSWAYASRTPIVAHSPPMRWSGDRERCLEAGMDSYVTKPVETQQLVEAMQAARGSAVRSQPSRRILTSQPPPSGTPVRDLAWTPRGCCSAWQETGRPCRKLRWRCAPI
jgi:CheY-like chemotaxis protein